MRVELKPRKEKCDTFSSGQIIEKWQAAKDLGMRLMVCFEKHISQMEKKILGMQ